MLRIMFAALAVSALFPAAASAQGAPPPPGQGSIIAVRVGSTATTNLCLIAVGLAELAPPKPGDPPGSPWDPAPASQTCVGTPPIRLDRARHMTVTLLGQAPAMGARWFEGRASRPLVMRPVGQPPTAIWFVRLPLTSGRLVLRVFFPPSTAHGGVTQGLSDYKVSIRRKARSRPRPPVVTEPVLPIDTPGTSFQDRG